MLVGINVEHPVAHTHTQNGLAESLIKRLQLIAQPLLMKTKLPTSAWGHAIMHDVSLVRIRPTPFVTPRSRGSVDNLSTCGISVSYIMRHIR